MQWSRSRKSLEAAPSLAVTSPRTVTLTDALPGTFSGLAPFFAHAKIAGHALDGP
jgi:hypothetical protein